jgi:hypothetical protein
MASEDSGSKAVTDAYSATPKFSKFVDAAHPATFMVKNTGLKVVRIKLQGSNNGTDWVDIMETDGTATSPDLAASAIGSYVIESPYNYVGLNLKCPTGAETSTCTSTLMWSGH